MKGDGTDTHRTKRRGRPRVITPAIEAKLLDLVTGGCLLIDACRAVGIAYRTVAKKEREDSLFMRDLARARVAGAAFRLERAEKALDRASNQNIAVVREQVLHMRWVAAKLIPAFKDRLEVAGEIGVKPLEALAAKPFAEWSASERREWAKASCFLLAQLGQEVRALGLEEIAEALGLVGLRLWQGVTKGAGKSLALLPAELKPAEPTYPGPLEPPALPPPEERSLERFYGSAEEHGLP